MEPALLRRHRHDDPLRRRVALPGSPIGRMPLVKLFAGVLRKDADGKHYLVTPAEKIDVAVEDAPFLAVEMEVQGSGRDQRLVFRTNVDDIVKPAPSIRMRFAVEPGSGGPEALSARARPPRSAGHARALL